MGVPLCGIKWTRSANTCSGYAVFAIVRSSPTRLDTQSKILVNRDACTCHDVCMIPISDPVREVLDGKYLAHLVTLNEDGSPQVTIVWVGTEGDDVVAAHLGSWKKVKNIQRDPRVALSIETGRPGPHGLDEYLVLYGTAWITEGGAPEVLQRLANTYIGPDVKFPPMDSPPPGYVTHIRVERVAGNGDWDPPGSV